MSEQPIAMPDEPKNSTVREEMEKRAASYREELERMEKLLSSGSPILDLTTEELRGFGIWL